MDFWIKITEETFILITENKQYALSFWKVQKTISPLRTVETKVQDFFNILKRQFHEAQLVHPEGIERRSVEVPNSFEK